MKGRVIYLMGPSGSGKDSLLSAAAKPLAHRGYKIVSRLITRSKGLEDEASLPVSQQRFAELEAAGAFALSWQANGLSYGIPRQLDEWLREGYSVLVNGSRGHFEQARQRYPDLLAVLLRVDTDILRARLIKRGRETREQIEQRLLRNDLFAQSSIEQGAVYVLDNSGEIQSSANQLISLITDN